MAPDFAGYATKNDIRCSDGRTIRHGAFGNDNGKRVPLVWQHDIKTPENILGHAILHQVADGVRIEGFFNDTPTGQHSKMMVQHGDVASLSIRAGGVRHKDMDVIHGSIHEVSLVVKGANPGALIDYINVSHDNSEGDTVIIYTGEEIVHSFDPEIEFDIEDPDFEHFGVKGMKWGVRKDRESRASDRAAKKEERAEKKEARKVRRVERSDARYEKSAKSVWTQMEVYDKAAAEYNAEDVPRINSKREYRGKDLSRPSPLAAKYMQEHADAMVAQLTRAVDEYPTNASGTRKMEIVLNDNDTWSLRTVEVKHDDDDIPLVVEWTDDGQIASIYFEDVDIEHADDGDNEDDRTLRDIYETLDEDQKNLVGYMVEQAMKVNTDEESAEHSEDSELTHKEGSDMTRNTFDESRSAQAAAAEKAIELTHAQVDTIFADAKRLGSLKDSILQHADEYGITNIELLFPEAKLVDGATPEFIGRDVAWVAPFLAAVRHNPFTRIKSWSADITHDEARAKGYVKATLKKDEYFALSQRTTGPTTVYKKQKLDRDDILDITSFDVVSWLKAEMTVMIREEIARAILLGDGREVDDDDKIKDPMGATSGDGIRSVVNDHDFYAHKIPVPTGSTPQQIEEIILRSRKEYKGTNPNFYTTEDVITDLLLQRDNDDRRVYKSVEEVAASLRVRELIAVEPMEQHDGLLGIMLNPSDYTTGTDRGGDLTWFEQFDIDYNQEKYLIETRLSGALTKHKRAIVYRMGDEVPSAELRDTAPPTRTGDEITLPAEYKWAAKNEASGEFLPIHDPAIGGFGGSYTLRAGESVRFEVTDRDIKPGARTDWIFSKKA